MYTVSIGGRSFHVVNDENFIRPISRFQLEFQMFVDARDHRSEVKRFGSANWNFVIELSGYARHVHHRPVRTSVEKPGKLLHGLTAGGYPIWIESRLTPVHSRLQFGSARHGCQRVV